VKNQRAIRVQNLPENYAKMAAKLSFTDWIAKPAFAYVSARDWQSVSQRALDVAFPAVDGLRDDNGARRKVEKDILTKMTVCWRSKGFGSAFQEAGISQPLRDPQIRYLLPKIKEICLRIVSYLRAMPAAELREYAREAGYPIRKGKGPPFFLTGRDTAECAALVALHSKGSFIEASWHCEQVGGYGTPMAGSTLIRIQAANAKKPRPRWEVLNGKLTLVGQDRIGPKVRKVTGLPFAWNFWQAPVFAAMRLGYTSATGRGTGTLHHAARISTRPGAQCSGFDASSFDDTVGLPAIDAIIEHGYDPITHLLTEVGALTAFEAERARDAVRTATRTPVITPPGDEDEGARLTFNSDGVLSGLRGTSVIDTIFTAAVVESAGRDLGMKLGDDYDYDTFGDDTLVADYTRSTTKWTARFSAYTDEIGVVYERADEASFLYRRIPSLQPYLGRMLLRTINREEREEAATIPLAALGIATRLQLLCGDIESQRIYLRALYAAEGPDGRLRKAAELAARISPKDFEALGRAAVRAERSANRSLDSFYDEMIDLQRRGLLPLGLTDWAEYGATHNYAPWSRIRDASLQYTDDVAAKAVRDKMQRQADSHIIRNSLSEGI